MGLFNRKPKVRTVQTFDVDPTTGLPPLPRDDLFYRIDAVFGNGPICVDVMYRSTPPSLLSRMVVKDIYGRNVVTAKVDQKFVVEAAGLALLAAVRSLKERDARSSLFGNYPPQSL